MSLFPMTRVYYGVYKGAVEGAIYPYGPEGEPVYPYFEANEFEYRVTSYFKENATRYCKGFDLSFRYGDYHLYGTYYPREASFTIDASLYGGLHFKKTATFTVRENS